MTQQHTPHYFIHIVSFANSPIPSNRKGSTFSNPSALLHCGFPSLSSPKANHHTMPSILGSQCAVLATAMAISGTVIFLALRLQKSLSASPHQFPAFLVQVDPTSSSSPQSLRSCISSDGKDRSQNNKKKKRVHFAEDVIDPIGYSEEFKRQHGIRLISNRGNSHLPTSSSSSTSISPSKSKKFGGKIGGMPANRMALYNGNIRDRVFQSLACSY
ncbi:hypothetical protein SAY86_009456 [Trapa natans]|uniref:Uncharacterized protein n=1 Tax=Trapa natans TaxID=22666 RepID=A0AAN7KWS5_TRANT|nr:hypothetical protein SAY86_009456 [Trapa natans]